MQTKNLLFALLALPFLLLTSCLEEETNGLGFDYDANGNAVVSDAVLNGTGLPTMATLESVTYVADKEEIENPLGHIEIAFGSRCSGNWCNAVLDDCGINSDIGYQVEGAADEDQTIAFRNVETSWSLQQAVENNLQFKIERQGATLTLICTDCPGETWDGTEFEGRRVNMRVVR